MKSVPNYVTRWRYIVAIIPYYRTDRSSGTTIHYVDGTCEQYACRCEAVVEMLAKVFRTSVEVACTRAEKVLEEGGKRKPPLALQDGFCLVQLKYRKKIRDNDSTIGYVVLQYIKLVEDTPDGNSRIIFHKHAPSLTVLQKKYNVRKQIRQAWIVQNKFDEERRYWDDDTRTARILLQAESEEDCDA